MYGITVNALVIGSSDRESIYAQIEFFFSVNYFSITLLLRT